MKNKKCQVCGKTATNHSLEIRNGKKIEKHLCDQHASEQGLVLKAPQPAIDDLLTKFVKSNEPDPQSSETACESCGLSFTQFRESSILGCPDCYEAFQVPLCNLLERAHEGSTHHMGKVPRRAGAGEEQQRQVLRMRKRLEEAITEEDYELAARLRDDIERYEENPS